MFSWLISVTRRMPTPEEWAKRNANITTPDKIIAEAIALSLKLHFDKWKAEGPFEPVYEPQRHYLNSASRATLINSKKKLKVVFGQRKTYRTNFTRYNNHMAVPCLRGTTVNEVEIDPKAAEIIWLAYHKAKKVHENIEKANSFVLADMKKNEMAWDLVESLLGLRRNANGALEPIKTAES